jgi:hypothetical protein
MMLALSRGDAVRDTPRSIPNRNWTTEPEFIRAKSGNWVNEGNPTAQPQLEPLEEDYGSRGRSLGRRGPQIKALGRQGRCKVENMTVEDKHLKIFLPRMPGGEQENLIQRYASSLNLKSPRFWLASRLRVRALH